ncbi:hypothetical protein C8R45DRAFT_1114027 [Mycena sanguinolenta]|nr:hypothetical protein C8R45DRAFT_1114027 [Mycena sanguinolenta]
MLCPSTPSVQPSTDELASYHAFPVSTRLSHPLLAVTGSIVALPCSPSLTRSPRRRTYLPANPGKGICGRRLRLGIMVQARKIPPHSSRAPSLDSAPPPTVSSAPTEPRSMPNPTTPVPPAPVASRRRAAQHSRFASARADTTHTHTPQRLAPERNHSLNESRPRTKTTARNRCDDAVVRSTWAIAQTHISTSHTLPTSEAVATSDSLSPRHTCLSSDLVTSPAARTRVGTSLLVDEARFDRSTRDPMRRGARRTADKARKEARRAHGFHFDYARRGAGG